jgi:hypothetical protein
VLAVRVVLPVGIVAIGVALAALGRDDAVVGAGVVLTGVGMLVALLNVLMRLGIESGGDRDREEAARRYFDRHGRWPAGGR